jgi:hypothetical protein
MYSIEKYDEFKAALSESEALQKKLEQVKKDVDNSLKIIVELLTVNFDKIEKFIDNSKKSDFKIYSAGKAMALQFATKAKIEESSVFVLKLKELNEKLKKDVEGYDSKGFKLISQDAFSWKTKKMREYSFSARHLSIAGLEEGERKSVTYTVAKYQGLVLFGSAGIFYTGFEYQNFGLENGVIVETKETPVYVRPALFLNLLFKVKSDIVYPFAQIGITSGVDNPLVPFGLGVFFRDNFSISGGGLLAWQNKLSDSQLLGKPSDDASLKNSIVKRPELGFYISLNLKLGK